MEEEINFQEELLKLFDEEDREYEELERSLVKATDPGKLTGRPKVPDSLTDVLLSQLKPTVRVEIARSLIDIAKNATKDSDRLSAIKEIYDRVEGKSRQRIEQKTAEDDPILRKLTELYSDEANKKHNSSPFLQEPILGEVRELE